MKLGLGLYRNSLTPDNFRFARQAGATHIVAHPTPYQRQRLADQQWVFQAHHDHIHVAR